MKKISHWNYFPTRSERQVLQIKKPTWLKQSEPNSPYQFPLNVQILQVTNGLEKIDCEIIMRCRSDQFIHNPKIFDIYFVSAFEVSKATIENRK